MTRDDKWWRRQELIEEYKATQKMVIHFDNLTWQVGSVLVGAVAVTAGFAFGRANTLSGDTLLFLFLFSGVLMGTWSGYPEVCAYWNSQKIKRLWKLEEELCFHQHRLTAKASKKWYVVPAKILP